MKKTFHIHIQGQVQGVGFRPFVYKLAREYRLDGWVNNTLDGVHVEVCAQEDRVREFYQKIIDRAPLLSRITKHDLRKVDGGSFNGFEIIHSDSEGQANLLLTPDFGMCDDCRMDSYAAENRRKGYPFTTCTNCGPRYSIIHRLPYDRHTTTMEKFRMCPNCEREYWDPEDRRYYSQTNSCPDCPVNLQLFSGKNPVETDPDKIPEKVVNLWKEGEIVAIKGIGGYLLTCDAANETAILQLRERKHRPSKPFALMFPDLRSLKEEANISEAEMTELGDPVNPILLLNLKNPEKSHLGINAIAPGLHQIGAMLPYTPLFDLLLNRFGKPVVATSGNISNSPIVFQDHIALDELTEIAGFVLINDREIVVPQDDSVIQFSPYYEKRIILRRSRGLAPTYINPGIDFPKATVLATGAELKSTFTLVHRHNCYISQYLGDLDSFDTQESFRHTIQHFFELFSTRPEVILTDKHPNYTATQYGRQLAEETRVPVHSFQHHIAHFGAILGENHLIHSKVPVLGVIWDGTGLGDDGQIWGGEFIRYENYGFQRFNHFDYFPFILGDKMPREPRISLLAASWGIAGAGEFVQNKFSKTEWQVYNRILKKEPGLKTSSLGRIFDAVASLLGIIDRSTYEGEAAMYLESLAGQYIHRDRLKFNGAYLEKTWHGKTVPTRQLLAEILADVRNGLKKEYIAAKFHFSLAKLIIRMAKQQRIKKIAFSGGVFQNSLLVDMIVRLLGEDYDLYFHQLLSPNDENISFGQLMCYQIQQLK